MRPPLTPKQRGRKSATTHWVYRARSSRGMITIMVMTLFQQTDSAQRWQLALADFWRNVTGNAFRSVGAEEVKATCFQECYDGRWTAALGGWRCSLPTRYGWLCCWIAVYMSETNLYWMRCSIYSQLIDLRMRVMDNVVVISLLPWRESFD